MVRLDMKDKPINRQEEQCPEMQRALGNLQGNILRGHGRKNSINLFMRFQEGQQAKVREQIRRLVEDRIITSALEQRIQSDKKKQDEEQNSYNLFCSFFLSAQGYQYLYPFLYPYVLKKFSEEFQGGIQGARIRRNDSPEVWEKADAYDFHAMILLAQADEHLLCQAVQDMKKRFATVIQCPTEDFREERGKVIEVNKRPVEHFGFVDNISQPLFFQEDIEKQTPGSGARAWNPGAGPNLALVQDPYGGENACGSYLVFLKLEQNAQDFALKVQDLALQLGLGEDIVRAFIMGRFQDGTPVVLQDTPGRPGGLDNFSFSTRDRDGTKCPYHAHIRKVNPRDDTAESRMHRIVRRGITYGKRKKEPKDNPSPEEMPKDGVGLLFMCYQRDIKEQFEYVQFLQANNVNFRRKNTGIDPIIGQTRGKPPLQKWPAAWGAPRTQDLPFRFSGFVTIKGGEYFFAPSLSFLKNL